MEDNLTGLAMVKLECGAKVECSGPNDKSNDKPPNKHIKNKVSPECIKSECASVVISKLIEVKEIFTEWKGG